MWSSLSKLATLAPETQVFCGHEYTLANIRFALAVEPDNRALNARRSREEQRRALGQPTLPSTIGEERATNPFLRVEQTAVKMAAEAHAGRSLANAVAAFAELRAWKNAFQ
jgi:hydroxyacylglutathione hydrolase